jgi:hypothetical protein
MLSVQGPTLQSGERGVEKQCLTALDEWGALPGLGFYMASCLVVKLKMGGLIKSNIGSAKPSNPNRAQYLFDLSYSERASLESFSRS